MKTLYIIEDEETLRNLYPIYLKNALPGLEIIGSSGNGREAVTQCLELKPDIVIVDIRLPEVSGLEILHVLKNKLPATRILISSGVMDVNAIRIAIQAKVDGVVEKSGGMEELKKGVEALMGGGNYFNESLYNQVLTFEAKKRGE
ncbi:MAG: response regulator transcription factor [Chthoniobacterales bacterium]